MGFQHGSSYYRAFCCHVHTCTFVIALVVVLFWLTVTAFIILQGELLGLVLVVPPLFSYGCLLIGNRFNRPAQYCPFLIVNLALVIGAFIFAGIFYLTGAAFISHNLRIGSEVLETFVGSITILTGTGVIIFAFLAFYYFFIVWRDYEFVKQKAAAKQEKEEAPKARPTRQKRLYVLPPSKPSPNSPNLRRNRSAERILIDREPADDTNTYDRLSFSSVEAPGKWKSERDLFASQLEPEFFPFNRNRRPSADRLSVQSQWWRVTSV
ncbi:hypothetical protein M3Y99_00469900 [Aphelenchoides fujianensis]|nr:hypothetical protein M3Y99_00469900 [Aphelenchoides fujianensis]